ncbi:hypothetical protein BHE74_00027936 [Ensete ventricosum]|nr:hypothetical protein BHE74_00027936 [Ensete ventricosum]RZS08413.1 hypothetical protein BHM03_00039383 [Ensete ventricosum]
MVSAIPAVAATAWSSPTRSLQKRQQGGHRRKGQREHPRSPASIQLRTRLARGRKPKSPVGIDLINRLTDLILGQLRVKDQLTLPIRCRLPGRSRSR